MLMVCKAVGGLEFTLTPTLSLKGEGVCHAPSEKEGILGQTRRC